MSQDYNATVTMRVDIAPGTMALRVKLDSGPFPFEPGQYTVLGLRRASPRIGEASEEPSRLKALTPDHLIRRAYAITSKSRDDELEFVVTLVRTGELTPRLFALREGGRLYVQPHAQGIFTLRTASGNRDLLLVATGTALAPYLSMIRTSFRETEAIKFVVVHAASVSRDLAFRAQMEELASHTPRLSYLPTIMDPAQDPDWTGLVGSVETLLHSGAVEEAIGMPVTPERFDVFLSGSPQMIDAVTAELVGRGFTAGDPRDPASDIHVERYW